MSNLFPDNTPTIEGGQDANIKQGRKYNRSERRSGLFVIRNLINGKFVKKEYNPKTKKGKFKDVELKECSVFDWKNVSRAIGELLLNAPNANVEVRLLKKNKKSKKIILE